MQSFTYDALSRIKSFDVGAMAGQPRHQDFNYDSFGNLSASAAYNTGSSISTVGMPSARMFGNVQFDSTQQWPYNAQNRLLDSTFDCLGVNGAHYDAAGNTMCGGSNGDLNAQQYVWDAESRLTQVNVQHNGNTYAEVAAYVYGPDGNRVRADQMAATGPNGSAQSQSFKEYSYFGGPVLAEKDQTGNWTNLIYANGRKIARVVQSVPMVHFFGSNSQSGVECGASLTAGLSYPVQTGDKLSWLEYKKNAVGGTMQWFDNFSIGNQWRAVDLNGQTVNQDFNQNQWVSRTADLSAYAGHTLNQVGLLKDLYTAAGPWEIWYADVALISSDGSVTPLLGSDGQAAVSGAECQGPADYVGVELQAISTAPAIPGSGADTHYYMADELGTTQLEFASGGYPVWRGEFAPFGQEVGNQATANHYKFTGKERDAESGLDYFGARYMSSAMGRWMSPDWNDAPEAIPYGNLANPQSLNLYAYVLNNPLSLSDDDGHDGATPAASCSGFLCWLNHIWNKLNEPGPPRPPDPNDVPINPYAQAVFQQTGRNANAAMPVITGGILVSGAVVAGGVVAVEGAGAGISVELLHLRTAQQLKTLIRPQQLSLLRQLFGDNLAGARAALQNPAVIAGLTRQALLVYKELAERVVAQGPDKSGYLLQSLRLQVVEKALETAK